jgi:hypothetical protein
MNITKDFHEYIGIVKNLSVPRFKLSSEIYSPIDKCSKLLGKISEVESNIEKINSSKINYI